MTKQTTKSAATDLQSLFDPKGYQDVFKSVAQTGERMTALATDAATRSTEIASESAKEAYANLREVSQVRDEPADFGKAYSDFAQKQMELAMRTAQAMVDLGQKTGAETSGLASKAGEDIGNTVAANAQGAVTTARTAAQKTS